MENKKRIAVFAHFDKDNIIDDYVIYFDQLKYTTNTLANVYDGYALKDADFGESETTSSDNTETTVQ